MLGHLLHNDVIKWKIFNVTGPLCGEFTGEFPSQRPVTRCFDVFSDLGLDKRLSNKPRRRWFETPSPSLWRHFNEWDYTRFQLQTDFERVIYIVTGLESWTTKATWFRIIYLSQCGTRKVINNETCDLQHDVTSITLWVHCFFDVVVGVYRVISTETNVWILFEIRRSSSQHIYL